MELKFGTGATSPALSWGSPQDADYLALVTKAVNGLQDDLRRQFLLPMGPDVTVVVGEARVRARTTQGASQLVAAAPVTDVLLVLRGEVGEFLAHADLVLIPDDTAVGINLTRGPIRRCAIRRLRAPNGGVLVSPRISCAHLGRRACECQHESASVDGPTRTRHTAADAAVRTLESPTLRACDDAMGKMRREFTHTPIGKPILPDTANWLHSEMLKTRVEHGYCARHPAAGACPYANICGSCDNYITAPEFRDALGGQLADIQVQKPTSKTAVGTTKPLATTGSHTPSPTTSNASTADRKPAQRLAQSPWVSQKNV